MESSLYGYFGPGTHVAVGSENLTDGEYARRASVAAQAFESHVEVEGCGG